MMGPGDGCAPGVSPSYRVRARVRVPTPVAHQRHVLAMAGDVLAMFDQPVAHFVLEVSAAAGELRQTIDDVLDEVEAIHILQHRHIEGARDRPYLLLAARMQVRVVPAAVGEAMDEPRIAVEGEDDRSVL